jgi:Tfp pilus assembly pilus retraction ATPase PilT
MGMYAKPDLLNWFVAEYPKHCKTKLDMGKSCVRFKKIHEIPLVIETSAERGMIPLNRYLADLVKRGEINLRSALNYSLNPSELNNLIRK